MDNSKWTLEDEIDYVTEQIADGEDIGHNTSAHQQLLFSWFKELKDLREKIEDRRLIELPCKIGDTVYIATNWDYGVVEAKVTGFVINAEVHRLTIRAYLEHPFLYSKNNPNLIINRYIFFDDEFFTTKEEAESVWREIKSKEKSGNDICALTKTQR